MPPMTVRDQSIQSQSPPFSLSLSSRQEAAIMDAIQSRPRIEGGKSYKKAANKVLIAVALFEKFDNFVHNELFLKIVLYICSEE